MSRHICGNLSKWTVELHRVHDVLERCSPQSNLAGWKKSYATTSVPFCLYHTYPYADQICPRNSWAGYSPAKPLHKTPCWLFHLCFFCWLPLQCKGHENLWENKLSSCLHFRQHSVSSLTPVCVASFHWFVSLQAGQVLSVWIHCPTCVYANLRKL